MKLLQVIMKFKEIIENEPKNGDTPLEADIAKQLSKNPDLFRKTAAEWV